MSSKRRISAVIGAVSVTTIAVAAFGISPANAANTSKVSGQLKGGKVNSVIVLGANGQQLQSVTPKSNGKFKVTVAKGSSLHLVGQWGDYAGPIVLGSKSNGKSSYSYFTTKSLPKSIDMGTIKLKSGYGYAKKPLSTKVILTAKGATAIAKKGAPIGAKMSGLVSVAESNLLTAGALTKNAADLDRDGYPNVFDIDLNGNTILNNVDRATLDGNTSVPSIFTLRATRAKGADVCPPPPAPAPAGCTAPAPGPSPSPTTDDSSVRVFSNFKATAPEQITNANLMLTLSSTDAIAKVNAGLKSMTTLAMQVVSGGTYQCSMAYCPSTTFEPTAGSTGDFQWPIGNGVSTGVTPAIAGYDLTYSAIGSGDVFTVTKTDGTTVPGVLNFAFTTTPALKSYQLIGADGTAGTEVAVTYSTTGPSVGTRTNPIVTGGSKIKLNWYVPQRLAVSGEAGFGPDALFMNMGGLNYLADMPNKPTGVSGTGNGGNCKDGSLLNSDGTTATGGEYVTDTSADDASEGRTFSFIVDVDKCVGNFFGSASSTTWTDADFDIKAQSTEGDNAALKIQFRR